MSSYKADLADMGRGISNKMTNRDQRSRSSVKICMTTSAEPPLLLLLFAIKFWKKAQNTNDFFESSPSKNEKEMFDV